LHIHIGIDDTDSRLGGCTTYLASKVVEVLSKKYIDFLDYPNLIRLNPNIPWKTKGNAAVSLRFQHEEPEPFFHGIQEIISERVGEGANPGLIMFNGQEIPEDVRDFSKWALSGVVSIQKTLQLIKKHRMSSQISGNGMGLIGALAAIGETLPGDHTFELLAYRRKENWGSKRRVDAESVVRMAKTTYPHTYNNYDPKTGRILITPHGPDPVLLGIRGETPSQLIRAFHMVKIDEQVDHYLIFRTNQGTGLHLHQPLNLKSLKTFSSGQVTGRISSRAWTGQGGHVYFKIKNTEGEAPCAVYEPTGDLRRPVLGLIPGDMVEVGGGVRKPTSKHPSIINVEYVRILSLVEDRLYRNPICVRCGRRMTSQGRGQGYRCRNSSHEEVSSKKVVVNLPRTIKEGRYIPPPSSQRHLTKPLHRYGFEKNGWNGVLASDWYWISK
jgi:tRNA(Ile2)-agmatinylcytidine synthase